MNNKSGIEAVLTDAEKNRLDECWVLISDVALQEQEARYRALVEKGVLVNCRHSALTPEEVVYHYPDPYCSYCGKEYFPGFDTTIEVTVRRRVGAVLTDAEKNRLDEGGR